MNKRKPKGYWTYDKCKEEALKYTSRSAFQDNSRGAYRTALKNGWMEYLCSHMVSPQKPSGYWDYNRCKEEALKYTSRSQFYRSGISAYKSALKNLWLDSICSHMDELKKPKGFWFEKENCVVEAKKYNSRNDFYENSKGAYDSASKHFWLDEICKHMDGGIKPKGYWDIKDNCLKESKKYETRNELQKGCRSAYRSAMRNEWMDEICSHMKYEHNSIFGYNERKHFVPYISDYFQKRYKQLHINFNKMVKTKCNKKRYPDCYIPELNLIIEYDEPAHDKPSNRKNDILRENELYETLKCDFIRVKENPFLENPHEYFDGLFQKWLERKHLTMMI